jgi:tetratricopeptide (TPR) repeat protein
MKRFARFDLVSRMWKTSLPTLLPWPLVLSICAATPAFAQTYSVSDAVRAYNAGNYRGTIAVCDVVLAKHSLAMAHYYRANALMKMGHGEAAKAEYQITSKLTEDVLLQRYCEAALAEFEAGQDTPISHYYRAHALIKIGCVESAKAEYERTLKTTRDAKLQRYCKQALAAYAVAEQRQASGNVAVSEDDSDSVPEEKSATVRLIDNQVARFRADIERQETAGLQAGIAFAKQRANEILQKASAEVDTMMGAHGKGGSMVYTGEQISAVRREAKTLADTYLNWAKRAPEQASERVNQRTSLVQESADGLQQQLKGGSGGAHLIEQGTSLFVRNYQSETTLNPAHAWISDSADQNKGEFITPLEATPHSLEYVTHAAVRVDKHHHAKSDIYGKLLSANSRPRS